MVDEGTPFDITGFVESETKRLEGTLETIDEKGWNYRPPTEEGDARKLVTLIQDGMVWVGIRAYDFSRQGWLNGGEPERAQILAWKPLDEPAKKRWQGGRLY